MFNHRHYVPILKWKQGEYQALFRLSEKAKNRLTPLFEIPPVGYDHERQQPTSTIEEHLQTFGIRLRAKWFARRCFVDFRLLGYNATMTNGQNCAGYALARARETQCQVVPVVSLDAPTGYLTAIKAAMELDRRGVCLRIFASDFDRADLAGEIRALLASLAVGWADTDLVLDLESFEYSSNVVFCRSVEAMLDMLPNIPQWRTITLAGTSYPEFVTQLIHKETTSTIDRKEWIAYKALVRHLGDNRRLPSFGDYAVAHPNVVSMDMRVVKPLAKLRYTIDDKWYVGVGVNVRTFGFGQYKKMCADLVSEPHFDGSGVSVADTYIANCATGNEATGNLTTWTWVSTNRHLTKVGADLAMLYAP